MTDAEKEYSKQCAESSAHDFYNWGRWLEVREQVLKADHYECIRCKAKYHRYRKATTVHHVNHFKIRPDLALEMYYRDPATHKQERNLISLCHDCHEEVHGWRMKDGGEPLTEERWD